MKITVNDQLQFVGNGKSEALKELNELVERKLNSLFNGAHLDDKALATFLKPSVKAFGADYLEYKRLGKLVAPIVKVEVKKPTPKKPIVEARKKEVKGKSVGKTELNTFGTALNDALKKEAKPAKKPKVPKKKKATKKS